MSRVEVVAADLAASTQRVGRAISRAGDALLGPADFTTGTGERVVPVSRRIAVACAIGACAFALSLQYMSRHNFYGDFFYPWFAARLLVEGHSPYTGIPGVGIYPVVTPFVYPLPSVIAAIPFSRLALPVGSALFFGLSSALLAFGLTKHGFHRLPIFLSAPFISAATQAQWSPLITASALLPMFGFLVVLKPNIGLAVAAYRPDRKLIIGSIIVLAASLIVAPRWPLEWWHNVQRLPGHVPPLLEPGGVILLLALLRWRLPEARLLLVMACVPQLLFWNDQLPLVLIPRTRRETMLVTVLSGVGYLSWELFLRPGENYGPAAAPYIMAFVYLPALLLVLRRRVPAAVPRLAAATVGEDSPRAWRRLLHVAVRQRG